eukprot:GHVN01045132.1.p1 GENE.GHVN01045132.1~~GHVN01045132.1.p1  ORF type:complete len:281 (-),score=38.95 GHVN01045132.1:349-1191(-)
MANYDVDWVMPPAPAYMLGSRVYHPQPTSGGNSREEIELALEREERENSDSEHDAEYESHPLQRPILFADDPVVAEAPIEGEITKEDFGDWAISALCGVIMGFALVKTLSFLPEAMHDQFKFKHWQLLKVLEAGAATLLSGSVVLSLLKDNFQQKRYGSKGFLSAIIGGLLLGAGVAVCGCSPGFEWIQVASGISNMLFVVLGGLIGALIYSFLDEYISKPLEKQAHPEHTNLDGMLGCDFWKVAAPVAIGLIVSMAGLEISFPFGKDYPAPHSFDPRHL